MQHASDRPAVTLGKLPYLRMVVGAIDRFLGPGAWGYFLKKSLRSHCALKASYLYEYVLDFDAD